MPLHMSILRSQLRAFGDVWQRQSDQPKDDWEIQSLVRLALSLHDLMASVAEHREPDSVRLKGETRDNYIRDFQALNSLWLEPTRELLSVLKVRKATGAVFEGLSRLETLCHETEQSLKFDAERTIRSLHSMESGQGVPIAEVRNELRRRVRS